MNRRTWTVQARGEDGLFRTVENGEHTALAPAFAQYVSTEGVVQLVRNDHIVLRSDQPHQPAQEALF